jgi:hypothetical protein|nr:hypothetical protein [Algoriphagus sp.]|tara:strand:+ start:842 stop:1312 length:471 start_codon:yes stop_codon:yes gene_type:complete
MKKLLDNNQLYSILAIQSYCKVSPEKAYAYFHKFEFNKKEIFEEMKNLLMNASYSDKSNFGYKYYVTRRDKGKWWMERAKRIRRIAEQNLSKKLFRNKEIRNAAIVWLSFTFNYEWDQSKTKKELMKEQGIHPNCKNKFPDFHTKLIEFDLSLSSL